MQQPFKTPERSRGDSRSRTKLVQDETGPRELTRGIQVPNCSKSYSLSAQVTNRGCLNRTGNNGQLAGIGTELVEEPVFAAATDDANALQWSARELLELLLHVRVSKGETVEDRACQFN